MLVVVDDNREFPFGERDDEVIYLRTPDEAMAFFVDYFLAFVGSGGFGRPDIEELWLDHDLGEDEDENPLDTWELVKLIDLLSRGAATYGAFPIKSIYVHSQNNVRAEALVKALEPHFNILVTTSGLPEGTVTIP